LCYFGRCLAAFGKFFSLQCRSSAIFKRRSIQPGRGAELAEGKHAMKRIRGPWPLVVAVALATFLRPDFAFPQAVEEPELVEYRDGRISVAFDHIPVDVALYAIQAKTGVQIVIPPAPEIKLVNLRVTGLPLEPAMRSFINSIGFRSFALMYDEKGRPSRAVVLDLRPETRLSPAVTPAAASQASEAAAQPLTAEERDQLQKQLERWGELNQEDRERIEVRLKALPPSDDRELLISEYGRQILGIKK
jgi:hypothetical protein